MVPGPTTLISDPRYLKGYWNGLDATILCLNSIDTRGLSPSEVLSVIQERLRSLRPQGALAASEYKRLLPTLKRAWENPFTTRSDYARKHIEDVALAACLGLLTVKHHSVPHDWGRTWRITSAGLALLENT